MRILVVEDEHKIANSLKKGLEQEHYIVDVVYTGTEGYDFAISESYDLLILDRLLPGMDGVTITKKLRGKQIHTPILMLTAKGQVDDRVEGLNAGADDYLPKPFAFTELVARVRALTRRPKTATTSVLQLDELIVDTVSFTVTREKILIQLSNKEFTLLEYLIRHQGTIVTKEQIINNVWNYDSEVLPNSVEVYIKHLRNKIDKPFSTPLIHTVRGFGYKLAISQ